MDIGVIATTIIARGGVITVTSATTVLTVVMIGGISVVTEQLSIMTAGSCAATCAGAIMQPREASVRSCVTDIEL